MIAKIIRGTSFKGVLKYVMNDKSPEHSNRASLISTNCAFDTPEDIDKEMRLVSDGCRLQKPVMHIVLSHNKDKLDNDDWATIADFYMEKMGLEGHQFVLVRHNDTENDHCHLIVNAVNMETGKGFNSSHERYRSLKAVNEITKELNLTPNPRQSIKKHKAHGNENIKAIQDAIDTVLSLHQGKGIKPEDFEAALKEMGVIAKRAENVKGIQGYSFKVEGSKQAFTGKRLGADYKLSGLEQRGLLTPKVLQQQAELAKIDKIAKVKVEQLTQHQMDILEWAFCLGSMPSPVPSPAPSPQVSFTTNTHTSKGPVIGLTHDEIVKKRQKAMEDAEMSRISRELDYELSRRSRELDYQAKQAQLESDRVRLRAERASRKKSKGIER